MDKTTVASMTIQVIFSPRLTTNSDSKLLLISVAIDSIPILLLPKKCYTPEAHSGSVAERLKAPVSKTGKGESSSRVQIPPLPQEFFM